MSARYYEKCKEKIQNSLAKGTKIFLKERKAKSKNDCEWYKNLSEDKKKLVECKKRYYKVPKIALNYQFEFKWMQKLDFQRKYKKHGGPSYRFFQTD